MNVRRYSMATRGQRAAETHQRILDAARQLFEARSSGFTLENVATAAGTSVQTVLRAFGSKESLMVESIGSIRDRVDRFEVPESPEAAVTQLFDDYETIGDRVVRMLAEEHHIAGFADAARLGRASHRGWVETAFRLPLRQRPPKERESVLVALLVATDVYVWKVLRRDLCLDRITAEAAMMRLVRGALGTEHGEGGR